MSIRHACRERRLLLADERLLPLSVDRWARPPERDLAAAFPCELITIEMAVTCWRRSIPKILAIA